MRGRQPSERLRNRPKVMHLFGWLVLAGVTLNVLALLLFSGRFRADAIAQGQAAAGWFVAAVLTIASNSLFWWRIAICAGNLARWLYIGLVALSLLQLKPAYDVALKYGPVYGTLVGITFVLSLGSITILLRRDVAQWLHSGGRLGTIDPTVFE
ncbi:hypothetical protein BV97_02025 [Novosphingobium resinovorum]|uniref:Uncharacterized protein n=1 Tax=Novosphingobium resinovorum TaxID=158500 RepID=A0A031K055_9SPHN|nr:hypothetical protein BV97_02025 [Novosphingobium resinovorum]